jgi:cellobiose phosphorylase
MGFAAIKDGEQAFNILSILNPINHSLTLEDAYIYAVEPYVIPADVYANPASVGRGGWTWYTGSAAWYYRAITESILGLYREGHFLRIDPCLPKTLSKYQINYKFGKSIYEINVKNSFGEKYKSSSMTVDGEKIVDFKINLKDDGEKHFVDVFIA